MSHDARGSRRDPSVETRETNQNAVCCPYCEGTDTEREHPKGPSLCRSIYFCHDCQEPFEAMA